MHEKHKSVITWLKHCLNEMKLGLKLTLMSHLGVLVCDVDRIKTDISSGMSLQNYL